MSQIENVCLLFDDRELRDDFLHITVSGLLVFAKSWVMQVHLLQGQQVLTALLSDLSFNSFIVISDSACEPSEALMLEDAHCTLKTLPKAPVPRWSSME